MEENTNIEQQVQDWFKSEIDELCDENGMIEQYWDYRDEETLEENLPDLIKDYDGNGSLIDYIVDTLQEDWMDWGMETESGLATRIKEDAEQIQDETLRNAVLEAIEDDIWDNMYNAGYNGVNDGIRDHLENLDVNVNITLATANEANYDMSSIIIAFGTDYLSPEYEMIDASYLDNALTYLVNQQGHSIKELYDDILGGINNNSFIHSVATEVGNNPAEATTGLTVLVHIPLGVYDKLKASEGTITVDTSTEIGLYNSWIGGGSVFEISLEKPFTFPTSMVSSVDLDNVTYQGNYSVGDCYGTMNDDRKGNITFGSGDVAQMEDLESIANYVKETYGKEDNEDE